MTQATCETCGGTSMVPTGGGGGIDCPDCVGRGEPPVGTFADYLADKRNREAVGDAVYAAGIVEAAYYNHQWADLASYMRQLEDRLRSLRLRSGRRFTAATPEELD